MERGSLEIRGERVLRQEGNTAVVARGSGLAVVEVVPHDELTKARAAYESGGGPGKLGRARKRAAFLKLGQTLERWREAHSTDPPSL